MNIRATAFAHSVALTCIVFGTPNVAFAQAAPAAQEPAVAKHSCVKPPMPDAAKKISAQEKNIVVKNLETYRTCVRTFSDAQEKIKDAREKEAKALQDSSQVALAAAKAAAAAVDTAVKDYNDFSQETVKRLNKDEPAPKAQGNPEGAPPRPSKSY